MLPKLLICNKHQKNWHVKKWTRKLNLNWDTKMPDLSDLTNLIITEKHEWIRTDLFWASLLNLRHWGIPWCKATSYQPGIFSFFFEFFTRRSNLHFKPEFISNWSKSSKKCPTRHMLLGRSLTEIRFIRHFTFWTISRLNRARLQKGVKDPYG